MRLLVSEWVCWGAIIVRSTFIKKNRKNKMMQECSLQSGHKCQMLIKLLKSTWYSFQKTWFCWWSEQLETGRSCIKLTEIWNHISSFSDFFHPFSVAKRAESTDCPAARLSGQLEQSLLLGWLPGTTIYILQSEHIIETERTTVATHNVIT